MVQKKNESDTMMTAITLYDIVAKGAEYLELSFDLARATIIPHVRSNVQQGTTRTRFCRRVQVRNRYSITYAY
jgi:hypothetical protein